MMTISFDLRNVFPRENIVIVMGYSSYTIFYCINLIQDMPCSVSRISRVVTRVTKSRLQQVQIQGLGIREKVK